MNKVVIYILHKMEQHPAQGLIEISKVTGTSGCFGSSITSDSHIVIKVYKAEKRWRNTSEYYIEKDLVIQLKLTHYQFVELIMSATTSQAIPCTLQSINGEAIEEFIVEDSILELYKSEIVERFDNSVSLVDNLSDKLTDLENNSRIPKKTIATLKSLVSKLSIELTSNVPWVIDRFTEEMETKYTKIKAEASAWIAQRINTIGLQSISSKKKKTHLPPK